MKTAVLLALSENRREGVVLKDFGPFDVTLQAYKELVGGGKGPLVDYPVMELWASDGSRKVNRFKVFMEKALKGKPGGGSNAKVKALQADLKAAEELLRTADAQRLEVHHELIKRCEECDALKNAHEDLQGKLAATMQELQAIQAKGQTPKEVLAPDPVTAKLAPASVGAGATAGAASTTPVTAPPSMGPGGAPPTQNKGT